MNLSSIFFILTGGDSDERICWMNDILDWYERPYNPAEPVVGLDDFIISHKSYLYILETQMENIIVCGSG
jgi:hypothetical protein